MDQEVRNTLIMLSVALTELCENHEIDITKVKITGRDEELTLADLLERALRLSEVH